MITTTIKFFFIFYFAFYICFKIMNISSNKLTAIVTLSISLLLAVLANILTLHFAEIKYIIPPLLMWLLISIYSAKPQISFVASIFSFVTSYSIHAISSFMISTTIFIIYGTTPTFPYLALSLLSSILHALFVFFLFQIKRFQRGMQFLITTPIINLATTICIMFISALVCARLYNLYGLAIVAFVLTLPFLIYWWQAQITKSYRRSLELRELESLRTELQEKNATIVKVMEENERIRHINHRDNGLITALDYAVNDYLVTDFTDEAAAKARRDELLIEIERIRAGRVSSVNKDKVKATRYETNISLLNILLNQTSKRATDEHVLFSVHFGTELEDFIPRIISEDDLAHLLSDMLENAFIATRDVKNPMIQLQFYKWNKHFVIEIADNGIPFEVDSILNMGISELTTHADTGGSGIGLMDIWSTKEKYGATYHIDEYETPAPFSKKISLTFDKKNRYSVRTWRKDEILAVSKRADLQVYGQDE